MAMECGGQTVRPRAALYIGRQVLHGEHAGTPPHLDAMSALAAFVTRGFRRVERAGEALLGTVGPFFVAIYVGLVGTGMLVFCTLFSQLMSSRVHFA